MFCTICGSWNDDDTIYCSSCGGYIGDNSVTENNNNINNHYNVSSHNNFDNQQNTNSYYNIGNQQNINSNYNMNSQHNTSIVNKDDVNRTKFNPVWSIFIVIFSIIGCVCVFFNSYVIEAKLEIGGVKGYSSICLNGFEMLTGEYQDILNELDSTFKALEVLQVVEIIYIILIHIFAIIEMIILFASRKKAGYVTTIITSFFNISIALLIKIIATIIIKEEVEYVGTISMLLGSGMILSVFMQIIKIIISSLAITVSDYKNKIKNMQV